MAINSALPLHGQEASSYTSLDTTRHACRDQLGRFEALETRGYRLTKRAAWQVALDLPSKSHAPIVHVSPEDLWVAWDEADAGLEGQELNIQLPVGTDDVAEFAARVTAVRTEKRQQQVGLRLLDVSMTEGQRILRYVDELVGQGVARPPATRAAVREPIRDEAYIAEVAESFARENVTAVIRSTGPDAPHTLKAVDFTAGDMIWEAEDLPEELTEGGAPFILEGRSLNSVFWIPVLEAEQIGEHLVTKLPSEIMRVRNRWRRRVQAPKGARIRFRHPLWPDLIVAQKLHDISYTGLGFQTDPTHDLVYPGMRIENIEIQCDGHAPVLVSGEVRTISSGRDRARVCGIQLGSMVGDTAARWLDVVNEVLHPRTRTGSQYSEPSWDLFEASGYFRLSGKDQSQFLHVRDQFMTAGRKLGEAEHVGFRAVWPSDRGVEASLSFIKPYSSSWLGHQMAKRPGAPPSGERPRQVLRDIYMRAYEPVQNDSNLQWLIGYCENSVRWMKSAHTDFALRFVERDQACAEEFRLMEVPCAPGAFEIDDELEVGPATEEEVALLLSRIARERPKPYCESLDLVPERFWLDKTREEWTDADMQLERSVLVVRRDGKARAAMILEAAELGTNLFHLLDGVRIFSLQRNLRGVQYDRACSTLFEAAIAWFQERDRSRFMYFLEGEMTAHTKPMKDLGEGRFWVLAAELLPDFLEHIHRLTAPSKEHSPGRKPVYASAAE